MKDWLDKKINEEEGYFEVQENIKNPKKCIKISELFDTSILIKSIKLHQIPSN